MSVPVASEVRWGRSVADLPEIPPLSGLVGNWEQRILMKSATGEWPYFNPSVFSHNGVLKAIVRSANYITDGKKYCIFGTDFETVNYIVDVDDRLTAHNQRVVRIGGPQFSHARNRIEDCRLFSVSGNLMMICTVYDQVDGGIRNSIHLCQIGEDGLIQRFWKLASPFGHSAEKNWMPLVIGSRIFMIYSINPYRIIRVDLEGGSMSMINGQAAIAGLQGFSGSSCAVPYRDGHLGVFHCRYNHNGRRRYSHRFVKFSSNMKICAYSDEFFFENFQIEFCAGLTQIGDDFVISYGVQDRRAMLARFPVDAVAPLLSPAI